MVRGVFGLALVLLPFAALPAQSTIDKPASIVALVARVIPSVVAIHTQRSLSSVRTDGLPNIQRAEGSGFIVSADGFIATNKHVIEGAYDVTVTLTDGRTLEAKIVWKSTVLDVAFLQIKSDTPLLPVTLAADHDIRLGQRVVAIGNPQGLGISVSSGVVSALNRNIKQSPYDDFIQTDAAINHGNSGGPLFDESGNVIGMNSILWSSTNNGGSEGLGFAIPASDLSFFITQLKKDRRIRCGWLGLRGQKVTPAMQDALNFPGPYGVIVATVDATAAAAKAGLRRGDIIRTFDGKALPDITTLNRAACLALGRTVSMDIWRDGRFQSLEARVAEAEDGTGGTGAEIAVALPRFASAQDLGITVEPLNEKMRREFDLGATSTGFVVTTVVKGSQAEASGLSKGDVIISLQMAPLSANSRFDEMFAALGRAGHRHVLALIQASGGERWITLPVTPDAPP